MNPSESAPRRDRRADERRPPTDAERKALASVLRLRILRLCLYEELTNQQIAEKLGRNPATTLHHVRTLVDQEFLEAGEVRRGTRGAREVPYRSTGKSWSLENGPDGSAPPLLQTFWDEVSRVPALQVESSRLGLQLPAEKMDELRTRLFDLLQQYAREPLDPSGERMSLFVAIHPEPV